MKNLKKVLCALLAVCAFSSTAVFALPSQTTNGSVVTGETANGEALPEGTDIRFVVEPTVTEPAVVSKIENLNNAATSVGLALSGETVVAPAGVDVSRYSLLTKMQDLAVVDSKGNVISGVKNVQVTWEVPNLTEKVGMTVKVLHYSTARKVWEVINPDNVNAKDKLITATFQDLSPVGIIYQAVTGTGWQPMGNGNWNFYEADGSAPTKWICSAKDVWYYVDKGVMQRNHWVWRDKSSAYYVGDDGIMLYGPATTPDGYQIDAKGLWYSK